ncbi:ADP-ribose pyrophosphatase YjhB (NUDIX family) [Nocardioides thalensis]|uniref:ADP-ribose pyrophosphatase YjhB (NUDIX family) n=1 Tax=Nocardioides thalensis TaxID=1914755 RepID=A0A853C894_9ACTN|nr:NUDIX hydrolase [Nocardioides thalensis]NYJ02443.1 ADP-ribose pyrophosphatase YjhB (NUDIX family) [Nocardioides thalensis]
MAASTDGGDLTRHPRPNVAIDVAVLTALPNRPADDEPGDLLVLVIEGVTEPGWVLPGRFLRKDQSVESCVEQSLDRKAGLRDIGKKPRLLRVFDDPKRDKRGWTLSIGHSVGLPHDVAASGNGRLARVDGNGKVPRSIRLLFDHDRIVEEAVADMRRRYEILPDPDGLLTGPFTMTDLRLVHEAVLGERLQRDSFKRRMVNSLRPVLKRDGSAVTRSDGGRPTPLFTHGDPEDSPQTRRRLRLPRLAT